MRVYFIIHKALTSTHAVVFSLAQNEGFIWGFSTRVQVYPGEVLMEGFTQGGL